MDEEIEVIGFDVEEQTNQKEQKQEQIEKVEVEAQSVQTTTAVEQQVESVQIEKPKKQRNIKKLGKRLIFLSVLLIPLFGYLYVISTHSTGLINATLSQVMLIATGISTLLLLTGIILVIVNRKQKTKPLKVWAKLLLGTFLTGYLGVSTFVMVLLYGPNPEFKNWLVTTAMTTMTHQYFATWFYDQDTIKEVMSNNVVIETNEGTNPDLIQIGGGNNDNSSGTIYANEYEEEILKRDEGNELYKIIEINTKNRKGKPMKGKLAVIYDPSKVKIATSKGMGLSVANSYGQMVGKMADANGGIIGMNASGFFDPGYNSRGGVPRGYVISNGKLVANNKWGRSYGGLIGFDSNNRLILDRSMSSKEAMAAGIRDAIQYGPYLIVNGKASFVKGNGGWGYAPRSAIGQRADGIVLLLVIDGRQTASAGADMGDLVDIFQKYGAVNAANLDGGTSSSMTLNGQIITNPRNGNFAAKTRIVPNAWIVTE